MRSRHCRLHSWRETTLQDSQESRDTQRPVFLHRGRTKRRRGGGSEWGSDLSSTQPPAHLRLFSLTPGLSSFRNSIPAFSSTATTLPRVSVRAPTGPSKFSIRRMVPRATRDLRDSSPCDQLSRARAARRWEPVRLIKLRRYHGAACKPK